jgi:hypothetical protein
MARLRDLRLACAWRSAAWHNRTTRKDLVSSRFTVQCALLLWSAVVVGCSGNSHQANYETVYLRNSATGQVVACGPYKSTETSSPASAAERSCIDDYQRQGFVQVPVSE